MDDASGLIGREIEVYEPSLDRWQAARVCGWMPEVCRLVVEMLEDASRRLLALDKVAYRVIDDEQQDFHAIMPDVDAPEDVHDDAGQTVAFAPRDEHQELPPDLEALQREQEQHESWLRSFGASGRLREAAQPHSADAWVEQPLPPVTAAGAEPVIPSLPSHRGPLDMGDPHHESFSGEQPPRAVAPGVAASVALPMPEYRWYTDGFTRSDIAAELLAGTVLAAAVRPASVSETPGNVRALLTCSVLRGRDLSVLAPAATASTATRANIMHTHATSRGAARRMVVRVSVVRPPSQLLDLLQPVASHAADGRALPFTHRLRTPVRVNPITCLRKPLFRTEPIDVHSEDVLWTANMRCISPSAASPTVGLGRTAPAGGGVGMQFGACVVGHGSAAWLELHRRASSSQETSAAAAALEWGDLGGYLLFQVMEPEGGAAAKYAVLGQGLLRICDVFAAAIRECTPGSSPLYEQLHGANLLEALAGGMFSDRPPQEWFLRLWLPLVSATGLQPDLNMTADVVHPTPGPSMDAPHRHAAPGVQPAIFISVSVVLPPVVALTADMLLREVAEPDLVPMAPPAIPPRRTRAPARAARAPRPANFQIARSQSPLAQRPGAPPARQASHSARRVPSHGTPWQAIGAVGLPEGVRPDDVAGLQAHVSALHSNVVALQLQLQQERIRLSRARAEHAKLGRLLTLLRAQPSPIINLARASISSARAASIPSTALDDQTSELRERARVLQATLRRLSAGAPATSPSSAVSREDFDALQLAVARTRGRVVALEARLARSSGRSTRLE